MWSAWLWLVRQSVVVCLGSSRLAAPCSQGYLVDEEPSGYFNSATEEALKRWHQAHGITQAPGIFGVAGRALYAKARFDPAFG